MNTDNSKEMWLKIYGGLGRIPIGSTLQFAPAVFTGKGGWLEMVSTDKCGDWHPLTLSVPETPTDNMAGNWILKETRQSKNGLEVRVERTS